MKTLKSFSAEDFYSDSLPAKSVSWRLAKSFLIACCLGAISTSQSTSADNAPKKLIVHEWGTFTSLQGGDGEPILWRTRNVVPLPSFVYNWTKPGLERHCISPYAFTGKGEMLAMQRMETPVIYFYSEAAQTVDLTVRFPKGLVTEWFPQAQRIGPAAMAKENNQSSAVSNRSAVKESLIHWKNFQITPDSKSADTALPTDKRSGHYFSARETDSALVNLDWQNGTNSSSEHEKFLFYRGVGNFSTPLKVKMSFNGDVMLVNRSKEALSDLFILGVHGDFGKFLHVGQIAPGAEKTIAFDSKTKNEPLSNLSPRLATKMTSALMKQKLFPREANAMVNTWKDLWFQEQGIRVLYLLPRAWTDSTLPLEMRPAPSEIVRVMVGRAEVISPGLEQKLVNQLARANENDADSQRQIQATLKEFGRFAEPILQRALVAAKIKPERQGRWMSLLAAMQAKPSSAVLPENKS